MKTIKFKDKNIFPVFYDHGLLFERENTESYLLYKDNDIEFITSEELQDKEVLYPENMEEVLALKNAIEYIYNRLLVSQRDSNLEELFQIIKKIIIDLELLNEEIMYEKLKIKFEKK